MKTTLYLLILFTVSNLFSQVTTKLKVLESQPFREQVSTNKIVAMHSSSKQEKGIVKFSKSHITFDVFGEELEPIFTKSIESHKKEVHMATLYFEDQIKVFTLISPKKKERQLYCYTFDINTREHTKILLFKRILENKQSLFSGENKRQTSFAKSPNNKYIAITTDNIKKYSNAYTVHVYEAETLTLLFEKSYQESIDNFFVSNDIFIDDSANVYVLGKQYLDGRKDKKKKKANYEFALNKISKENILVTKIDLENEFIGSLRFGRNVNSMSLLGFYSERNSSKIKGLCNFIFDPIKLTILNKKKDLLPDDVYQGLYGYRNAKEKSDSELSNFYIDHILEDREGNLYMIAEEFYVTTTYIANGMNGGYMTTTLHYDDVLVIKFSADGKLQWGRSIFKRSSVPSYNAFVINNNLHLILNSGKNLLEKKDGRTKVSKGWFESSSLYDIVFDKNGEISYDKVQDNKSNAYYLPAYGTFSNDNSFIMMDKGKTDSSYRNIMILKE